MKPKDIFNSSDAQDHLLSIQKMLENNMQSEYIIKELCTPCTPLNGSCQPCYLYNRDFCNIFKPVIIDHIVNREYNISINEIKHLIKLL